MEGRRETSRDGGPRPGGGGAQAPQAAYYADASSRVVALVVDAVALSILILLAAIPVSLLIGPAVEFDSAADQIGDAVTVDETVAAVDCVLALALSAGYFVFSWWRKGGTPGQRLLDLSVVRADDGTLLGKGAAGVRWALVAAPFGVAALLTTTVASVGDGLVDACLAAWYLVLLVTTVRADRKRGLHDRAAGSVVVKRAVPARWEPESTADVS
jgi:uncharacterized RDD family membrane protein YckC